MKAHLIGAVVVSLLLTGCESKAEKEAARREAQFAEMRAQEEAAQQKAQVELISQVKSLVSRDLNDPASTQFRAIESGPVPTNRLLLMNKEIASDTQNYRNLVDQITIVCGEFNSKNKVGAYAGFRPFTAVQDRSRGELNTFFSNDEIPLGQMTSCWMKTTETKDAHNCGFTKVDTEFWGIYLAFCPSAAPYVERLVGTSSETE